jgi:sec-independent protein translocase protein TatA
MFKSLGTTELLIILAVVVLIFGVGRLGKLGRDLGEGIREFRKGVKTDDEKEAEAAEAAEPVQAE